MYLLGYDIGSSSVKASLVDVQSGKCAATAFYPKTEAPIISHKPGWAEQDPAAWMEYLTLATKDVLAQTGATDIAAIGISYQMHGLVCVDRDRNVLRPAIIWCDSRAVPYGQAAFEAMGADYCLSHLLNSPGNFTAAKLAWVKENEPEIYARIWKVMLPGDYVAMRLTGSVCTTAGGLSEEAAAALGLKAGIPVTYRAGDQPNNALSLGVFNPGEIASTAGTSGVVYGVTDKVGYDPQSRVNSFAHVNYTPGTPRLGVLLCINGTGILNSWMRRNVAPELGYQQMNELAAKAPIGSGGVCILPFGNGAERMLGNRDCGCSVHGVSFNIHGREHLLRAAQEGIVFSFQYGMEIMEKMGMKVGTIHAGNANMFLSPIFRETLAGVSGATIELYDTDGSAGAARGAGIGAGVYRDGAEAFATLERLAVIEPTRCDEYRAAYENWKSKLTL